jgi:hypothetical protein
MVQIVGMQFHDLNVLLWQQVPPKFIKGKPLAD